MSIDLHKVNINAWGTKPTSDQPQTTLEPLQPKINLPSRWTSRNISATAAIILFLLTVPFICYNLDAFSAPADSIRKLQTTVEVSASEQFTFQVYCPINKVSPQTLVYTDGDEYFNSILNNARRLLQETGDDGIDRYVIYVQRRNTSEQNNSDYLFYCSLATDWASRDCSKAKAVCNTPGPIFYIEQNKTIDVAWVHNIKDSQGMFATPLSGLCYSPIAKAALAAGKPLPMCVTMKKKPGKETCTYLSPTDLQPTDTWTHDFNITSNNIPIDVHVHGLQVRPTFDGNPLSFMGKNGQIGLGFQTLTDERYYKLFKRKPTTALQIDPNAQNLYVKVNRYENVQPPGNLWYHDHSMKTTMSNVVLGLAGDYIIHKPVTDSTLPGGEYQILIVAGENFKDHSSTFSAGGQLNLPVNIPIPNPQGQNTQAPPQSPALSPPLPPLAPPGSPLQALFPQPLPPPTGPSDSSSSKNEGAKKAMDHFMRFNPKDVPFVAQTDLIFKRNQTYRIRILNAQFDSVFTELRFLSECDQTSNDPASCKKTLNFSVIGSDSSLFDKSIHNIDSITLASAQRFEVLIIFDGDDGNEIVQNPISSQSTYIMMVSGEQTVKNTIPLQSKEATMLNHYGKFPTEVSDIEGVTFYDLNQITQKCNPNRPSSDPTMCISTIRMRPIMNTGFAFFFNGHYLYSQSGKTDNPKIGTTEDWIFINTIATQNGSHPIHVHLINYQVIAATTLKSIIIPDNNTNTTQMSGPAPSMFGRAFGAPLGTQGGQQCSLYLIDYYIEAGVLANSDNMTDLCLKVSQIMITDPEVSDILSNKFPQDQKDPNTLISGFDVFAKLDLNSDKEKTRYHDPACPDSEYKYVCGALSKDAIPSWYRKWKEVVLVNRFIVMQVRIRWTSTEYNTPYMPDAYPYFNIPEDQIVEFPGYVYHCHFLNHEDNELMRPIMMEGSDQFPKNHKVKEFELGPCMKRNFRFNRDGWKARYECMNQLSGCTTPN